MRGLVILFLILLCGSPATAADSSVVIKAKYKLYLAGFVLLDLDTQLRLQPNSYGVKSYYHTKGIARLFSNAENTSLTIGAIDGEGVLMPRLYESKGHWDDEVYLNRMTYDRDSGLVMRHDQEMSGDDDYEYFPVPDEQKKAPDPLSYVVGLLENSAEALRVSGPESDWTGTEVFGGFFLINYLHRCPRIEERGKSSHSVFSGEAVYCEFRTRLVAGDTLPRDEKKRKEFLEKREKRRAEAKKKKPDPLKIWFGHVDGVPVMVPVYSEFKMSIGKAHLYLHEISVEEMGVTATK
ncbi:DUF3108 domain-containing protein [Emcibacter nanhaiensis]|uniref:DUF3108 domain-containing protein n=1 Tax=Emcibacter nanhaiensis TaxID=1505037 RepID=A0A501PQ92_9PROT|nr:DUF3108 domain-containing protein [Emcibacter nanhaiensis]TPD62689.1 DUF3108 domain-containing protein [Emcibacter nanhaiensis]